jgi:hypothetical protein
MDRIDMTSPRLGGRIRGDQPLVLRPRMGWFVACYSGLFLVLPVGGVFAAGVPYSVFNGEQWNDALLGFDGSHLARYGVAFLLALAFSAGAVAAGGPELAAGTDGVWIRTHRLRARSVFLPWPAIARIYARRTPIHTEIGAIPYDPWARGDVVAWARRDPDLLRTLFDCRLTASTFCSGRRGAAVLAELRRLAAGRTAIG